MFAAFEPAMDFMPLLVMLDMDPTRLGVDPRGDSSPSPLRGIVEDLGNI